MAIVFDFEKNQQLTSAKCCDSEIPITKRIKQGEHVLQKETYLVNNLRECHHYTRGCAILCPECDIYFPCHKCHDEYVSSCYKHHDETYSCKLNMSTNRYKVNFIVCLKCNTKHNLSLIDTPTLPNCLNCNHKFGDYTCIQCIMFVSDSDKKIEHCTKCNLCIIVPPEGLIHCDFCGKCYSLINGGKHNCINRVCAICCKYIDRTYYDGGVTSCLHFVCYMCNDHVYNKIQRCGGKPIDCKICFAKIERSHTYTNRAYAYGYDPLNPLNLHNPPKISSDIFSDTDTDIDLGFGMFD
jgi:hypothetical protein